MCSVAKVGRHGIHGLNAATENTEQTRKGIRWLFGDEFQRCGAAADEVELVDDPARFAAQITLLEELGLLAKGKLKASSVMTTEFLP